MANDRPSSRWWFLLVLCVAAHSGVAAQTHPFLIVREDMYAELQARAEQEPWASWKTSAMNYDVQFGPSRSYISRSNQLTRIVSRNALAYILDVDRRPLYVQRLVAALTTGWRNLAPGLDRSAHGTVVPPGAAFFNSVLALDIIYNDLTSEQRVEIESVLQPAADFYLNTTTSWKLNLYGNRLIWGLYNGDTQLIDQARADYLGQIEAQLSPDGVFVAGPGYAAARLGYTRDAKTHTIDVLEFTGQADLYDDPRLVSFYEWLYGHSVTPFRRRYAFGDSSPNRNSLQNGSRSVSAYRFSDAAAQYAAWNMDGDIPSASLLGYVLMEQPLAERVLPGSRVYPDGGAYFRERIDSPDALSGALNNVTTEGGHTHQETNAVHLAGYGEHLLRNSGYMGWGNGAYGFDWFYVNRTARSGNVVTMDDQGHLKKVGGGIVEFFTGESFDYASGNSGQALMGGRHWRQFCLVHTTPDAGGYFLLFDEVFPASGSRTADLFLHPNSDQSVETVDGELYSWRIGSFNTATFDTDTSNDWLDVRYSENDVHVTAYLATEPESATLERGLLAQWDESFVGEYLHAVYPVSGRTGFLTVILPHDRSHPRPVLSRLSSNDHSSATIVHPSGATDYAGESTSSKTYSLGEATVHASAAWYRNVDERVASLFIRKGTRFESESIGLVSDSEMTLLLEGTQGQIVSDGTTLSLRSNQAYDVVLGDGQVLEVVGTRADWIDVFVPAGKHSFSLATLAPPDLVSPDSLAFGELSSDRSSFATLVIENAGAGPMIVSGVRSDIEGLSVTGVPARIEPSASSELRVSVGGGSPGAFTGILEILTNTPGEPAAEVTVSGSFVVVFADTRADFDGSGVVDFVDFLAFAQAFGSSDSAYDIDGGGTVDFSDFLVFAESFGRAVGG